MRYLLDTHAIIWYIENNPNLSPKVRDIIENKPEICFFSIASLWEIAIKTGLGKLSISMNTDQIARRLNQESIKMLAVTVQHTMVVQTLPHHHRDPFDRMLIAQADTESCTVLTRDEAFDAYAIAVLW